MLGDIVMCELCDVGCMVGLVWDTWWIWFGMHGGFGLGCMVGMVYDAWWACRV